MGRTNNLVVISNHFADICAAQIYERLKKQLPARVGHGELQKARYKSEAAAGAIIRMLFKWLADGATLPVAEMIDYSEQILHTCCRER